MMPNSSFSKLAPLLQTAVDSTSLGEFKTCPRRYYYSIIRGLQRRQESVHLTFGILLHSSVERYHHSRAEGASHDEALQRALRWVLRETWDSELKRPWISDSPTKNRLTLARSLVWYLDQYGASDPLETVILENGRPAVELSFSFDSGYRSELTGETIVLCGHLDRLAKLNGVPYVVDLKTTEGQLSAAYFSRFSPDNQMSLYTLAGQVVYHQPVAGLIVDAVQVLVTLSRASRAMIPRDKSQVSEWHGELGFWLSAMGKCAETGQWPQNDKACNLYGGCQFRSICSKPPASRETWIKTDFVERVWDPLQRRGQVEP